MHLMLQEYGKIVLSVLISLSLASIVFGVFAKKWQEFGGVNDSIKTNFSSDEKRRTPPVLYGEDFKIRQGEKVDFSGHMAAVDFDGSDITSRITVVCKEEKKGIRIYSLTVRSLVTGKSAQRNVTVLLDHYPVAAKERGGGAK